MRSTLLALFFLFPLQLQAACPGWKPDIRFELEGAGELNTLAWIGGWSSAVSEASKARDLSFSVPECGYLISKEIVEILNDKYEGKVVSAEQAAAYIWPQLRKRLGESPNKPVHPSADAPDD